MNDEQTEQEARVDLVTLIPATGSTASSDVPTSAGKRGRMNSALMFSRDTDEWATPQEFFDELDAEFCFDVDAAATAGNAKCGIWYEDALSMRSWVLRDATRAFLNPPYSKCVEFVAKAASERLKGVTTVMLIPSRTDTRYWHAHIWDREKHQPREGVEVRFIKGRLKFGGSKNSAPFPSVVVVFRPASESGSTVVAVDRQGDSNTGKPNTRGSSSSSLF